MDNILMLLLAAFQSISIIVGITVMIYYLGRLKNYIKFCKKLDKEDRKDEK